MLLLKINNENFCIRNLLTIWYPLKGKVSFGELSTKTDNVIIGTPMKHEAVSKKLMNETFKSLNRMESLPIFQCFRKNILENNNSSKYILKPQLIHNKLSANKS